MFVQTCDLLDTVIDSHCGTESLDAMTCGATAVSSSYKMLFTSCPGGNLPRVESISKENATFDEAISISGSGFSSINCENEVLIGGVPCPLDSSTSTQLVCTLGRGSGLKANIPHSVQVKVKNFGFAQKNQSELHVKFIPKIVSFSPAKGSIAGGTNLTLIGDGFERNNTLIIIGSSAYFQGQGAEITENSISINTNAVPGNEIHEIQVFVNNLKAVCDDCSFEYAKSITPLIEAIHPIEVNGSTLMTLTGTFHETDSVKFNVMIGQQHCVSPTVASTTLTCRIDGLELGMNQVSLNIEGY